MEKDFFNKRKTYHLIPDNGNWKIVEEITNFMTVQSGKTKSVLVKEAVKLAGKNKPSRLVIYKAGGSVQEDRNYGDTDLPPVNSTAKIVTTLKNLIEGLYYPSESDYAFEIHTKSSKQDLTAELYKISGKPTDSLTEEVDFEHFFERLLPQDWMGEEQKKDAKRFVKLKQYLEKSLKDLAVTRIGEVEIDIFITGKTEDDNYIILKSTSIET